MTFHCAAGTYVRSFSLSYSLFLSSSFRLSLQVPWLLAFSTGLGLILLKLLHWCLENYFLELLGLCLDYSVNLELLMVSRFKFSVLLSIHDLYILVISVGINISVINVHVWLFA